ncbi:hypothetical protein HK097_006026, partial [Rhizophlyctis rosea]
MADDTLFAANLPFGYDSVALVKHLSQYGTIIDKVENSTFIHLQYSSSESAK